MKVSLKIVVPLMLVSGLLWSVLTMMAAIFKPSLSGYLTLVNCMVYMTYRLFKPQFDEQLRQRRWNLFTVDRVVTTLSYVGLAVPMMMLALTATSVAVEMMAVLALFLMLFAMFIGISMINEKENAQQADA